MRKIFTLLFFSFFLAAINPLTASDDIPAYLIAGHMSADDAEAKLKDAGFDVITQYKLDKKGTLTSVLFTNSALKKDANKKNRAFAG